MAIVHPFAQVTLSTLICENRRRITEFINTGRKSRSYYFIFESRSEKNKLERAFSGIDFDRWRAKCWTISARYPVVLKADISRFFYTIYTHSIEWAVIGKQRAKEFHTQRRSRKKTGKKHWSALIDIALQACQSRETFGIPVGPDTSRLIAEILLVGIERQTNLGSFLGTTKSARLIDDYFVGFNSVGEAEMAHIELKEALAEFNLQLNDEKTSIHDTKDSLTELWQLKFDELKITRRQAQTQARHIVRLVDTSLYLCKEGGTDRPAVWAARRLARLKPFAENTSLLIDGLFRLGRSYGSAMKYVAEFIFNNQAIFSDDSTRRTTSRFLKQILRFHGAIKNDFEISWALVIVGLLKLKIEKSIFECLPDIPSPVVLTILCHLDERAIIDLSKVAWDWKAELKKSGPNGEYWLPYYEGVKRRWIRDASMTRSVKNHPFLGKLLADDISFIETRIFDVDGIDVSRRRFGKPAARAQANLNRKQAILRRKGRIFLREIFAKHFTVQSAY